jgi:hypothetical protein
MREGEKKGKGILYFTTDAAAACPFFCCCYQVQCFEGGREGDE